MRLSPQPAKGRRAIFVIRRRRSRKGYPITVVGWTDQPPRAEGRVKSLRRLALYGLLPVPCRASPGCWR